MQYRAATKSDPPPSYPTTGAESRMRASSPSLVAHGWRPADEDDGPEAVAWRARTGLRRADRALGAIAELNANLAALNATITTWGKQLERHWKTAKKLAWSVGVPVLVAVVVGFGGLVWQWVSTLRH